MNDGISLEDIRNFYDNYLEKLNKVNNRHKRVFRSLDGFLPKNIHVLDIGCGTGITSKHLAEGSRKVTAIDLSPKLIDYASKQNFHDNVFYISADITKWKSNYKYDAITLIDVLEHISTEFVGDLIERLGNMTHEKSVIYINTPNPYFTKWLQINTPERLQIIDNPVDVPDIIALFDNIDFIPTYFQMYWMQYVEYVFIKKDEFDAIFQRGYLQYLLKNRKTGVKNG